ncbi:hypothetical protein [Oryza sativa Japonica Group]|uniref:Uncharacterized protein n=1 Tax=Oryza sativa subsp. japonica TaxID=39947 RepID=Q5NAS5_ORYSJ|nr:hypothetical protein [Oryza sativa Japonica Group]BAD81444.1 hypothetical protein [Oryza sativa Japonica Group]
MQYSRHLPPTTSPCALPSKAVLTVPYPAPPPDPRNPYSRIILMLLDTDVGKDEGIVEELDVVIAGCRWRRRAHRRRGKYIV